jgi:hypothetical protein
MRGERKATVKEKEASADANKWLGEIMAGMGVRRPLWLHRQRQHHARKLASDKVD